MHCRDAKTFPVVPRHGLVSYRGVLVSMVRHKKLLKAPKCLISLITLFFGTPCIWVYMGIYGSIWIYIGTYGYIGVYRSIYGYIWGTYGVQMGVNMGIYGYIWR